MYNIKYYVIQVLHLIKLNDKINNAGRLVSVGTYTNLHQKRYDFIGHCLLCLNSTVLYLPTYAMISIIWRTDTVRLTNKPAEECSYHYYQQTIMKSADCWFCNRHISLPTSCIFQLGPISNFWPRSSRISDRFRSQYIRV